MPKSMMNMPKAIAMSEATTFIFLPFEWYFLAV
ncbi:hypothetical protein D881_07730 [Corynebacterium ulcerans NCTC 12077]|nr:hypothetical protein D881_07730 [Corynebacterium ulcerans NCTC 12077]